MRKVFNSPFKITQEFGNNPAYYGQFGLKGHEGIDLIPTTSDWAVFCLADGVVVTDDDIAGDPRTDAYGKFVTIWHPSIKKATMYCHLAENYVSLNQQLKEGQALGKMGATGNSTGPHLHLNLFDVDDNGVRLNRNNGYLGGINPKPFLEETTVTPAPIPVITDDTLIPQIENKSVRDIKNELLMGRETIKTLNNKINNAKSALG